MKLIFIHFLSFMLPVFCLLLRQLPFNKTNFHKAKRPSFDSNQAESTYYSLTCFVLLSVSYTLLESSN